MLKTISEVKAQGWDTLVEGLGVAGATLFILELAGKYSLATIVAPQFFSHLDFQSLFSYYFFFLYRS